jgi:hypothetical protein
VTLAARSAVTPLCKQYGQKDFYEKYKFYAPMLSPFAGAVLILRGITPIKRNTVLNQSITMSLQAKDDQHVGAFWRHYF